MTSEKEVEWGRWEVHQGQSFRIGKVNGEEAYLQRDNDNGPISDRQKRILTDSEKRNVLRQVPRYDGGAGSVQVNHAARSNDPTSYRVVSQSAASRNSGQPAGQQRSDPLATSPDSPVELRPYRQTSGGRSSQRSRYYKSVRTSSDRHEPEERTSAARTVGRRRSNAARDGHGEIAPSNRGSAHLVTSGSDSLASPSGRAGPLSNSIPTVDNGRLFPPDAVDQVTIGAETYYLNRQGDPIARETNSVYAQGRADVRSIVEGTMRMDLADPSGHCSQNTLSNAQGMRADQNNRHKTHPVPESFNARLQSPQSRHQDSGSGLSAIPEDKIAQGKRIKSDGQGSEETLDRRYKIRDHAHDFFKIGKVFACLYHENHTGSRKGTELSAPERTTLGKYGQKVYTTIRRFAVVKEGQGYCLCIPIVTYGGQGCLKHGLPPEEITNHTVIYMLGAPAAAYDEERRLGMNKEPIAVKPAAFDQKLRPCSRLNFGKVYTVEWNVKVMDVGHIAGVSLQRLNTYFYNTINLGLGHSA